MTDGDISPFRRFDEHMPDYGWPRITCEKCDEVFAGRFFDDRKFNKRGRSCSKCANILIFDDEGDILNGYFFNYAKSKLEEVESIILSNVKACSCGGQFCGKITSKCPFCSSEIDGSVLLACAFVAKFPDQAFLTCELRQDFDRFLKERMAGEKDFYRHSVETAVDFYRKGYLQKPSVDQEETLRKAQLFFHTGASVFASQWLIEKPKRDLFGIYMDKLFEPTQPGRELANVMLQYNIAHAISVLAGSPFEKKEIDLSALQSPKEFEDVILPNQDVMNKVAGGWRQEDRDAMLRKVKKRDLFGLFGKQLNFLLRNQNEVTVPFIHRAQKEIDHWRNWWNENKDALPT